MTIIFQKLAANSETTLERIERIRNEMKTEQAQEDALTSQNQNISGNDIVLLFLLVLVVVIFIALMKLILKSYKKFDRWLDK